MKKSELRQIIREEVKQLTSAMRTHEARNEFQVTDFPEGTKILFKDGEEWIVVKPGMRGSGTRRKSDEITIRPFNKLAKDKNISLPIDINLEFLNANTKSINEADHVPGEDSVIHAQDPQVNEAARVPSNVMEFAKRKGSYAAALVKKAATWAEKAGKRITGGTAIGKGYDTLVLDMKHHGSEIYINLDNETIKLFGEEVTDAKSFARVLAAKGKSISESSEGRSQLKRKQPPAMLPESIGPEAAVIHSMSRAGQDAVQNFIMSNDLSAAKIIDYLKRNPDQRYNVRDLITGAGVGAQRLYRDKMLKLFR